MQNTDNKQIKRALYIFSIMAATVFSFSIFLDSISADWKAPTDDPPKDNLAAPLNQSEDLQEKLGPLWISTMDPAPSFGLIVEKGNVSVNTPVANVSTLYVNGTFQTTNNAVIGGSITANGGNLTNIANLSCTDCIALGSETFGNYASGVTPGAGISVAGAPAEGWSPTVGLNTASISGCTNPATSKIIWDAGNNRLTCQTDQTGGSIGDYVRSITGSNGITVTGGTGPGVTNNVALNVTALSGCTNNETGKVMWDAGNNRLTCAAFNDVSRSANGTVNYLPLWSGASTLQNSSISEGASLLTVNNDKSFYTTGSLYASKKITANTGGLETIGIDTSGTQTGLRASGPTAVQASGTNYGIYTSGHMGINANGSGDGSTAIYATRVGNINQSFAALFVDGHVSIYGTDARLHVGYTGPTHGTERLHIMGNTLIEPDPANGNGGRLFVSGTGDSYIMGQLGVGKNTPTARLDVQGNGAVSGTLNVGGRTTAGAITITNTGASKFVMASGAAVGRVLTSDADGNGSWQNAGATNDLNCTNCVALGSETTGNYVIGNSAGSGISVSGSSGEGWSPTISINTADIGGCTAATQKILWSSTYNRFTCATDQTGGGGGDPTPDTIADDGIITLTTETEGGYLLGVNGMNGLSQGGAPANDGGYQNIGLNTAGGLTGCTNNATNKLVWDATYSRLKCETNDVTRSSDGTLNYIPKWFAASTLTNSSIEDMASVAVVRKDLSTTGKLTTSKGIMANISSTPDPIGISTQGTQMGLEVYGSPQFGIITRGNVGIQTTAVGTNGNAIYATGAQTDQFAGAFNGDVSIYGTGAKLHIGMAGPTHAGDNQRLQVEGNVAILQNINNEAGNLFVNGVGNSYIMGRLGIGKNNPSVVLDVVGSARLTGNLRADGTGYSYVNGNFGIRNISPSTALDVTGNANITGNASIGGTAVNLPNLSAGGGTTGLRWNSTGGVVTQNTSSKRYKKNIHNYTVDIEKLYRLRPVNFTWKEDTGSPNMKDFGLIAEEVYEIYPELVSLNPKGQPESVDYEKLSIILLKAYQEQAEKNDRYGSDIEELKKMVAEIKKENDSLKKKVNSLKK